MGELEPLDTKQCMTWITYTPNPFTVGGRKETKRCENVPAYVVREHQPDEDGLQGAMSVCEKCMPAFRKQFDENFATVTEIRRWRGG